MKRVNKEELKNNVNAIAPKLPENTVVIVGARQIKNGQVEIEFAQSRALSGRKTSVLALLNAGDARFNTGRTMMRVWLMVSAEGFKNTFGEVEGLDIDAIFEAVKELKDDQRIAILKQAEVINVNGLAQPVKIVCKETIDKETLPKSIREQLADENVSDDIKSRYILQTKDGDLIVDAFGNPVYRRFEMGYGDEQDVLIEGKILSSELSKKVAGTPATATKNILSAVGNGLAPE